MARGVSSPSHKTIDMNTGLLSYLSAQGLRKEKEKPPFNFVSVQFSSAAQSCPTLQFCTEKDKKSDTCSLSPPATKGRDKKMSGTCSLFPPIGNSWPSYLLPSYLFQKTGRCEFLSVPSTFRPKWEDRGELRGTGRELGAFL